MKESKSKEDRLSQEAAKLAARLKENGFSLALAESLTGGLASSSLVSLPGASSFFKGSIVSYSVESKINLLNLDLARLPAGKIVSAECAEAMLDGLALRLNSDLALSFTGNAGPEADPPEELGWVFIGLRCFDKKHVQKFSFTGERNKIREESVIAGFRLLQEFLID